jgi:hypothetical protein
MRAVDMSLAIAPCSSQMPAKSPRSTTAILASAAAIDACAESAAFSRVGYLLEYYWSCSSSGEDCVADDIRLFKARDMDLCDVIYR